jgi:ABC-2 type transport system ATP-binding protein
MAGGSYGGGIQLVTAATDHRVDAIVPDIAWHSLVTSLDKSNTVKFGWARLLYFAATLGHARLDPLITASYQAGAAGGPLTRAERAFYATRGPGVLVRQIRAPTLLVQGTVDTLFTLQEAVDNESILKRDGVPVHMLWFCGGHGICLTSPGRTRLIVRDTLAWLGRYLKRDRHVGTGPGFEFVDQDGGEHAAHAYPLPAGATIAAHGTGTLAVNDIGGAGPIPPTGSSTFSTAVAGITPARASNAVNLRLPAPRRAHLIAAAPVLRLTYRGTATSGPRRTSIYAQLIDDATGLVLGNQITPIPIRLDGAHHAITLRLEMLSALDRRGEHFTLQLTPSTVAYQAQRTLGTVHFSRIAITLPAVAG